MLYILGYFLSWLPIRLLRPVKVINKKNIKKHQNYIICCNHQSNNDAILLDSYLGKKIRYMSKAELFKNKFSGTVLRALGAYPVKRGQIDLSSIKYSLKLLKNKKNLGLFPEGTRIVEGDLANIKNGAIMLSLKSKTPILPCVFLYDTNKKFRKNKLVIGNVIELYNMQEFKDQKITNDLIKSGSEILKKEMNGLKI